MKDNLNEKSIQIALVSLDAKNSNSMSLNCQIGYWKNS